MRVTLTVTVDVNTAELAERYQHLEQQDPASWAEVAVERGLAHWLQADSTPAELVSVERAR